MTEKIPQTRAGNVIANQIIRSGTSVRANYRAACRGKSNKDFLYKILIVEEADETLFWFELLNEASLLPLETLEPLMMECDELVAIFTSTGKTVRSKINARK